MFESLEHQGQLRAPSDLTGLEGPSLEHSAHQGSSPSETPLLASISGVLQPNSPLETAQRRIVFLEAELKGTNQDLAQLEQDVTRLTKNLRVQRNQIIVFERGEVESRGKIIRLEAENEKLRQQRSDFARLQQSQVGAFAADRKVIEEGIIENVSVDMETMIKAVHDLKACICEAVRAKFAAGIEQPVQNVKHDVREHLEEDSLANDKSGHTRTIVDRGSGAQDEQQVLLGVQAPLGNFTKSPGMIPKVGPQQENTLDHGTSRHCHIDTSRKALDDELHRILDASASCDLVCPRMRPDERFGEAIERMSEDLSNKPKASNKYDGLSVYDDEQNSLPRAKKRRTDR